MAGQSVPYRNPYVVTNRVVVPGPIAEYTQPWALTTGSQINEASIGGRYFASPLAAGSSLDKAQGGAPWPGIINGAVKFFNSWRAKKSMQFREIANHNVIGNYGSMTGYANLGFRRGEFDAVLTTNGGPVALYPGTVPNAKRAMANALVPIVYGLRVLNPVGSGLGTDFTVQPQSVSSQFTEPTQFTPAGTAQLSYKGVALQ